MLGPDDTVIHLRAAERSQSCPAPSRPAPEAVTSARADVRRTGAPVLTAIFGIEEAEGTRALVLELVEGPTLADRIGKGPIPLDEALPIAKQMHGL